MGCEAYKDDSEMEGDHQCPTHKTRCVERQEENYFFALSKYQQQIQVPRQTSSEQPACQRTIEFAAHALISSTCPCAAGSMATYFAKLCCDQHGAHLSRIT